MIAPEHLVTLKILAGRPKDLEDVRGMIRIAGLDHARIESTLAELESMLDQRDLLPVPARLRAEQTSRKPLALPARHPRNRNEPATARTRKSGR